MTLVSHYVDTYITAAIAQELAVEGPCHVIPTACAAGNYAIGWGMDMIRDGLIDVAIVGGGRCDFSGMLCRLSSFGRHCG